MPRMGPPVSAPAPSAAPSAAPVILAPPCVHNLGEMIDRSLPADVPMLIEVTPDRGGRSITFADFHAEADRVAAALQARGLARGAVVAIVAGNSARYLVALVGIMRAGLAAAPVNIKLPAATITQLLDEIGTAHVFVDAERAALGIDRPASRLDDDADWLGAVHPAGAGDARFASVAMRDVETALILFTSGSSGLPKGVPLTHGGYVWATDVLARSGPPLAGKAVLIAAPLFHMNGLLQSYLTAMVGGTVVLMQRFDARRYLEVIAQYRCSVITSVPTMLALVVREPDTWRRLDLGSVEIITTGSAPSTESLFDRVREVFPNARILNGWGTTEASPVAFGPHPAGVPRPKLSVGYPMPQAELRLVAPDGTAADVEGELWIRNRAVMPHYLGRPEETAKRLVDGWYRTGDVMRRDEAGFHYFVGRADDMFVCGGENVYPGEVERLLERHPVVMQAAVVPVADEIKGMVPVAFVVLRAGETLDEDAIRRFTREQAPAYQHPRAVWAIPALPLAGTNKVDRTQLARLAVERYRR